MRLFLQVAALVCVIPLFGASPAVVLFERALTEAERTRYEVDTVEEIVDGEVPAFSRPHWRVVRVELVTDGTERRLRATTLGRDLQQLSAERAWRQTADRLLAEGQVGDYRLARSFFHFTDGLKIFVDEAAALGRAEFIYRTGDGSEVTVEILESPGPAIQFHDFFHPLAGAGVELIAAPPGPVLFSAPHYGRSGELLRPGFATWMSGERHVVTLSGRDVQPFFALYGKKFPSSLASGVSLDRAAWARTEFDLTLKRLLSSLEASDPAQADLFEFHLSRAGRYLELPPLLGDSDVATRRRATYQLLVEWWQAHSSGASWDDRSARLVAASPRK